MEVRSIKDYKAQHPERRPRLITFHSAVYADNEKKTMSIVIPVMVKNGNVDPVLKAAEEAGGIA